MRTTRLSRILGLAALLLPLAAQAQQKRPLDHDAYDLWRSIVDQAVSNDGQWISYALNPREGDAELRVHSLSSDATHTVARGRQARFSPDSRFLVFLIKPELALVREARKEKKKPDEQPKDSLGILDLSTGDVFKVERVKGFKLADETGDWVAYLLEKTQEKPDSGEEGEPQEQEVAEEPSEEGQETEETKEKEESQTRRWSGLPGSMILTSTPLMAASCSDVMIWESGTK